MIAKHKLIIMGRKTYEANKRVIKLVPEKLRIVLTSAPKKFVQEIVPHQLEFSSEPPKALLKRLASLGYKEALIVGGSGVAAIFLHAGLINRLELTLEPYIFGSGIPFIGNEDLMARLHLIGMKKLNARGTIHLTYAVE